MTTGHKFVFCDDLREVVLHSGGTIVSQFQSQKKQVWHLWYKNRDTSIRSYFQTSSHMKKTDGPHTDLSEIFVSFLLSPAAVQQEQPVCRFLFLLLHQSLQQALYDPCCFWGREVDTLTLWLLQRLDALLSHQMTWGLGRNVKHELFWKISDCCPTATWSSVIQL